MQNGSPITEWEASAKKIKRPVKEQDFSISYTEAKKRKPHPKLKGRITSQTNEAISSEDKIDNQTKKMADEKKNIRLNMQKVEDFFVWHIFGTLLLGGIFLVTCYVIFDYELPLPEPFVSYKTIAVFMIYGLIFKVIIFFIQACFEDLKEWLISKRDEIEKLFEGLVMLGLAVIGLAFILFIIVVVWKGDEGYYYEDVPYEDRYPIRR